MPFGTVYLCARDHISSCIAATLTNGARVALSDSSGTSCGKFAIRTFLLPITATAILRSKIPRCCACIPLVWKNPEVRLADTPYPQVLCIPAFSGRQFGSCSLSVQGSVGCHGSIHGCHRLCPLG